MKKSQWVFKKITLKLSIIVFVFGSSKQFNGNKLLYDQPYIKKETIDKFINEFIKSKKI